MNRMYRHKWVRCTTLNERPSARHIPVYQMSQMYRSHKYFLMTYLYIRLICFFCLVFACDLKWLWYTAQASQMSRRTEEYVANERMYCLKKKSQKCNKIDCTSVSFETRARSGRVPNAPDVQRCMVVHRIIWDFGVHVSPDQTFWVRKQIIVLGKSFGKIFFGASQMNLMYKQTWRYPKWCRCTLCISCSFEI